MIQTGYYMVAATGVLVAAIYYVINLRTSGKNIELTLKAQQQSAEARQTQLFMDIYKIFSSKEFQRDRDEMTLLWSYDDGPDFFKKYGPRNMKEHEKWESQLYMYMGLGNLMKRGIIKPEIVFDLIWDAAIAFWEKFQPAIQYLRETYVPNHAADAEYLYNEMVRVASERELKTPNWRGSEAKFQKRIAKSPQ
jgi:hypothetical protein